MEQWKAVVGYEGLYEVSNVGEVRSLERIRSNGVTHKGSIKKQSTEAMGYKTVTLTDANGIKKTKKVHRLVAMAFISNPNDLPVVNHLNGNKVDNLPANLEWTTNEGNLQHAWATGLIDLSNRKHSLHMAKLSEDDVREIRKLYVPYSKEFGVKQLAEMYGVKHGAIQRIISGETWKNVS